MNIAVYHDLPSGGAKRALHKQVEGLVALGHRVTAYLPSTADEEFLPLAEVASRTEVFRRGAQPDRERSLERGPSPADALRWGRYLIGIRRSERAIAREVDAGGHDVVLVGASQFTQAPWLLRWLRTPSLYYCQEPLRAAYEPGITPPLVRLAVRHTLGRVDRRNLRSATAVAANSRFAAGQIERIYGRAPRVVYLGVDTDTFRPLPLERGDYVLAVAALHPLKGLDFVIDSLAELPAGDRPPLLVVSDRRREAERERLESRAAHGGVRVEFRFRVGEDELVRLYNQARLVVYAPRREPFGFVPLEAMACGRPVLGVREGGLMETIREGETGFLADRDTRRFAARIAELLASSEETERVAREAVAAVRRRWSWARSVEELANLCGEVALGREAPRAASHASTREP